MQNSEKMRQSLLRLFDSQRLAVLSTQYDGQPYASLIAFSFSDDLKELFFATPRTTRKYTNLRADPRVAMLIDSRSNQEADIHQAIAVTAVGKAGEVSEEERPAVFEGYLARHPHLEDFAKSPSCALIRVAVTTFYVVSRFQKVMELHVAA
jgi:nitroimidazol reductase NimA-like FMN-containing flavoprotein (pyridoxamine 5'-phosphate oxidase superfamily)